MLPDPDWKAENQQGVRTRISGGNKDKDNDDDQGGDIPAWMFKKLSLTRRGLRRVLQRRKTLRRNQPSPRKIMTMLDGMLRVKEGATEEECVAGLAVQGLRLRRATKSTC